MGSISWNEILLAFLGGISLFIFGMHFLTDGLRALAGKKLKGAVKKYTTNPIKGLLFGIVLTLMLQSSTGSIAIVVSLCTAGILSLRQSLPVLLGANIGSSITYFIIGFKIGDYALYIIAAGVFFLFLYKRTNSKKIGQVLFGFGAMFYGLKLMSGGINLIKDYPAFTDFIKLVGSNEYKYIGLVLGVIFTAIVHSSAATMGLIQGLYAEGLLGFPGAFAIALGAGIGTTLTAVFASLGGPSTTRKTALANVIYNVIGTVVFLILSTVYYDLLHGLVGQMPMEFQIAMYILIYRIISAVVYLPFTNKFIVLLDKVIDSTGEELIAPQEEFFSPEKAANAHEALEAVRKAVLFASDLAVKSIEQTRDYLEKSEYSSVDKFMQVEEVLNTLHFETKDFLIHLATQALDENVVQTHNFYYQTITDLERIGDLCKNVVNLKETSRRRVTKFSTAGLEELYEMCNRLIGIIYILEVILSNDVTEKEFNTIFAELRDLQTLENQFKERHYTRMCLGGIESQTSVMYIEILTNLERAGNHCYKIANNKRKLNDFVKS